ncbi:hypothetical protein DET61_12427 [Marinobacter nauticus]|uniref:Uncharacterized protein n=1 Tax=Marinobacter nauticus TaxID=2743 RepID=A0A368X5V6_MARNT|nr:hypothetical protein [Marinobacter nauticus]RCW62556.1 hypothetical protein DET61_12427 [Marinobacter nauticus]
MGLESIKRFSDELEARLFHGIQDLTIEEINAKNVSGPRPLPVGLSRERQASRAPRSWLSVETMAGHIEQLVSPLSSDTIDVLSENFVGAFKGNDQLLKLLRLNNRFPFVNFRVGRNALPEAQLNFPAGDFQDEEKALLQQWFNYVVGSASPMSRGY